MDLGANMVGNQPDDALAVSGGHYVAGISQAFAEPVDPEPPVWIEHYLDDGGVFEPSRNRRSKRRAQHPRTARCCFRPDRDNAHIQPHIWLRQRRSEQRG